MFFSPRRVLRHLVYNWLKEVSSYQNVLADLQLIHFYRYLEINFLLVLNHLFVFEVATVSLFLSARSRSL